MKNFLSAAAIVAVGIFALVGIGWATTVSTRDFGGTQRNFAVASDGGGNYIAMQQIVNPANVTASQTGGGSTMYHLAGGSAASTNSTSVVSGIHQLKSLTLENTGSSTIGYFRLYDSASAPTCSSATNAQQSIPVAAGPGGVVVQIPPEGWNFVNGIGFCITGGGADTDNTNAPTGIFVIASYN